MCKKNEKLLGVNLSIFIFLIFFCNVTFSSANNSNLAVDFGTESGLYSYSESTGFSRLSTSDPTIVVPVDVNDDGQNELAVVFSGGLFLWNGDAWERITTTVPEGMIAFNNGLVVDLGSSGIYQYKPGTGMTRLTTSEPLNMFTADLNQDGQDELVVTFSNGLYIWDGNWTQLTTSRPENIVEYEGGLAVDMGEDSGLHKYNLADGWNLLTPSNPIDMTAVDLDQDGQDELAGLIMVFLF